MARKPSGKPTGAPKVKIIWKRFEDLCECQCTQEEIAGKLGIARDTLIRRVKQEYGEDYKTVYKRFSSVGLGSLRSYQFAQAKTNTSMAIFLGKVLLKQKEDDAQSKELKELLEIFRARDFDKLKEKVTQD